MSKQLIFKFLTIATLALFVMLSACKQKQTGEESDDGDTSQTDTVVEAPISEPLVEHIYTADPSAHVFEDRLYIYPSHDIETDAEEDDEGGHFQMEDYHVFSMKKPGGKIKDHGEVLHVDDVPWADQQMWAPDAAHKDGKYYFYFPAKDEDGIFRIGVAVGDGPAGPFEPQPEPIEGSYSIDPAVYEDTDGDYYMYFGGIWGGQLQRWQNGEYDPEGEEPAEDEPALGPMVAKMSDDMLGFAEEPKEVKILDENGDPILAGDNERRFFEAAWIHKYDGKYYLSYSTGDTHYIVYATGDDPYGPFTYQGKILEPVKGWTSHHSIAKFKGQWYLFYHDTQLSGETPLRNIKMTELTHKEDGSIETIDPYVEKEE